MKFKYMTIFLLGIFLIAFSNVTLAKNLAQINHGKVRGQPFEYLQHQIDNLQQQLDEVYNRMEYLESVATRFFDMGDGTIRDNNSGLIWLKDSTCPGLAGTDSEGRANWETAKAAAAALSDGTCGLTDGSEAGDWRLPNNPEWEAFMSHVYEHPALVNLRGDAQWSERDAFTGVVNYHYWSSDEYDSTRAWVPYMENGDIYAGFKDHAGYFVWPVRSEN